MKRKPLSPAAWQMLKVLATHKHNRVVTTGGGPSLTLTALQMRGFVDAECSVTPQGRHALQSHQKAKRWKS